jgi:lipid-binding SYLF domain-containing protein
MDPKKRARISGQRAVSAFCSSSHEHLEMLLAQQDFHREELAMKKKLTTRIALVALLLASATGFSSPSQAETGQVAVVFTKGGFIIGVGGGEGVLLFRGKRYPFTVSGMSVGFTIGASTTKFVGHALNLKGPASIEGTYGTAGAGGALAAGAGGVQLQNGNGVILQLTGPRIGVEASAAVGGVTIRLK